MHIQKVWLVPPMLLAGVGGCQSYAPRPLDDAAHMQAWQERGPAADDVTQFAQRLAQGRSAQPFDPADGLTMHEGEIVALVFNRELRIARADVDVAAAVRKHAGNWDDPAFEFDALRAIESIPYPWTYATSLQFTIPLSGRLRSEVAIAELQEQLAFLRVIELELEITAEFRRNWLEWSAASLDAELNTAILEQINRVTTVVSGLENAGEFSRLESRLFRLEQGNRVVSSHQLESRVARLELQLKSLMGLLPESPVLLTPSLVVDELNLVNDDARETLMRNNAALDSKRVEYQLAERTLQREIRKQYPDLTLGPAYEKDDGQSRVGFVMGLPIPILNANKQGIAQAHAQRESARIAYESEVERLVSELAQAQIEWNSARTQRQQIETVLAPLVDEQLADQQRLVDLGELNTFLTLETVIRAQEVKSSLIAARLAEAVALDRIAVLLGRKPLALETSSEDQP